MVGLGGGVAKGKLACAGMLALLWSGLALAARFAGERGALGEIWRRWALPMAVLISAGHLAKGLAKFVSWAPFLPQAWSDPHGTKSVWAITAKTAVAPAPWLPIGIVAGVGLALVGVASALALREARLARGDTAVAASSLRWPVGLVGGLFAVIVTGWAFR